MTSNKISTMTSAEIRSKFLEFFKKRGHTIIESASLVTTDEKGITNPTLFNTAGMQPLIPYLLGKLYLKDGQALTRLVDAQKCLRTVDIESIGDKTHATFFEMLGNWSLGDYFKKEAIEWSFEFLTSKEEGLGLDPSRLYVTVFEGDDVAPRDDEAVAIWRDIFRKNKIDGADGDTLKGGAGRIFYMPAENNWWQAGDNGPCGPDSEMFYDIPNRFAGKALTKAEYVQADEVRDVIEIWNDVFMQYVKQDGKIVGKLRKPSVDTGAGLERLTIVMQGKDNIYDTDLFEATMNKIKSLSKNWELRSARIVADHIRASVFLIADGVVPSNTDRGYVLRKLIRRAVRHANIIGIEENGQLLEIVETIIENFKGIYREVGEKSDLVKSELSKEEKKFRETLSQGLREFEKMVAHIKQANDERTKEAVIIAPHISGADAFNLYQTYGFPLELIVELAKEKGISVASEHFTEEFKKHQDLSRAGAEQKFKGGLADENDEMVVRYHTATHLLHQALYDVLGDKVMQKGSNITPERLRFDFANDSKMTDEQKKRVEEIVNQKIAEKLIVNKVVLTQDEAIKTGAKHFFGEKYGDQVSVYFIGNDMASAYSKEFCGGPHVSNVASLAGPEGKWRFKIIKEEAVAQGVRRIKAVLQ